ncbi:hypothetical protein GE061_019838 [Apolygus lucorum]|uniref:Uncharacterized protein n=1 Tax=Apolygus lucorum TaxID=248454 RepID=A0A8S9XDL2_APOLU|nr:hypothetical protein GE061_019838 [Apolygus lucorum]
MITIDIPSCGVWSDDVTRKSALRKGTLPFSSSFVGDPNFQVDVKFSPLSKISPPSMDLGDCDFPNVGMIRPAISGLRTNPR